MHMFSTTVTPGCVLGLLTLERTVFPIMELWSVRRRIPLVQHEHSAAPSCTVGAFVVCQKIANLVRRKGKELATSIFTQPDDVAECGSHVFVNAVQLAKRHVCLRT